MPVKPDSVEVGKCYVTSRDQLRKVVEIDGDQVTYQSTSVRTIKRDWRETGGDKIRLAKFASDVSHEVRAILIRTTGGSRTTADIQNDPLPAGGLAGHECAVLFQEGASAVWIGALSGLIASILMAPLMITYHYSPHRH